MTGEEPVLFYTGGKSVYSLLSWQDDGKSTFLAFPGEDRRSEFARMAKASEKSNAIKEKLRDRGGMFVTVEPHSKGHTIFASGFGTKEYAAPKNYLSVGLDEAKMHELENGSRISVDGDQLVILPVSKAAQIQLTTLATSLNELPQDYRAAMLYTLVKHGTLEKSPAETATAKPSAPSKLAWLWIAIAFAAGVAGGGAGYASYLEHRPKADASVAPAPATKAAGTQPSSSTSTPAGQPAVNTGTVEDTSNVVAPSSGASADEQQASQAIKGKLQSMDLEVASAPGISPVLKNAYSEAAKAMPRKKNSLAEYWILARGALLEKNAADGDVKWDFGAKTNQIVLTKVAKAGAVEADPKNALAAIACLNPVPGLIKELEPCTAVNWVEADKNLGQLIGSTKTLKITAPPAPKQTTHPDGAGNGISAETATSPGAAVPGVHGTNKPHPVRAPHQAPAAGHKTATPSAPPPGGADKL